MAAKKSQLKKNPGPRVDEFLNLLKEPEVQSWRALMFAFKAILTHLERGLTSEDCSLSRFQILFLLYFEGDTAAVEIAKKMSVTRGNISTFLKRMESDGLIRPQIPIGQKRPVYKLTKKGASLFEKIFPGHIARVKKYAPKFKKSAIQALRKVPTSQEI